MKVKKSSSTFEWTTLAGPVKTAMTVKVEFSLPEFHEDTSIEWKLHLAPKLGEYDMIIGRDVLSEVGIDIHFSTHTCTWGHSTILMRKTSFKIEHDFFMLFLLA